MHEIGEKASDGVRHSEMGDWAMGSGMLFGVGDGVRQAMGSGMLFGGRWLGDGVRHVILACYFII